MTNAEYKEKALADLEVTVQHFTTLADNIKNTDLDSIESKRWEHIAGAADGIRSSTEFVWRCFKDDAVLNTFIGEVRHADK